MTSRKQPDKYPKTYNIQQPYIQQVSQPIEYVKELFQFTDENNVQKIMEYVIDKKIPLDTKNENNDTLFHIILNKNIYEFPENYKLNILAKLDGIGSLIISPNKLGITPLHLAAMYQYSQIIKKYCQPNLDINIKDLNGLTPLHYAIIGYSYPCNISKNEQKQPDAFDEIATKLFGKEDEIKKNPEQLVFFDDSYTNTERKCIKTNILTVDTLIHLGASINSVDKFGRTSLFYAIKNKDYSVIEKLLTENKEIQLNVPIDSYGLSPIKYFEQLYRKHLDIFDYADDINKILANFTQTETSYIRNYITETKIDIKHVDEIFVRHMLMLSDMFKFKIIRNSQVRQIADQLHMFDEFDPNVESTKKQFYDTFDILENEVVCNELPESEKIISVGFRRGENNKLKNMKSISELYEDVYDFCKTPHEYNCIWNQLYEDIKSTQHIFQTKINDIQINSQLNENLKQLFETSIKNIKNIIDDYNQLPDASNYVLDEIETLITHNISTTICNDLYRNLFLAIVEVGSNNNPKITGIDKLINYVKNTIKKPILKDFSRNIVSFLIKHTTSKLSETPTNLQHLLSIQINDLIKDFPEREEIKSKIDQSLSIYAGLCEIIVKNSIIITNRYFNYLIDNYQYIRLSHLFSRTK